MYVYDCNTSPEAVLGWKSYLHDVNELHNEENRAKKAIRSQEYTPQVVLSSLRRDRAESDLTLCRLVRVPHAPPPVFFDLYVGKMI